MNEIIGTRSLISKATIPGQVNQQLLGQLQLANFINEPGLQANGDNLLVETEASGPPTVGNPGDIGIAEATDLIAFILRENEIPAGSSDLPTDRYALARIRIDAQNPARK